MLLQFQKEGGKIADKKHFTVHALPQQQQQQLRVHSVEIYIQVLASVLGSTQ